MPSLVRKDQLLIVAKSEKGKGDSWDWRMVSGTAACFGEVESLKGETVSSD
jgi:hypothetical protein